MTYRQKRKYFFKSSLKFFVLLPRPTVTNINFILLPMKQCFLCDYIVLFFSFFKDKIH